MRWSRDARGRVPRLAHRRVSLFSARRRHYAHHELAVEAFKKTSPAELAKIRARLPKGVEIELWWQDEARIGQKNKLTRRWARRGTRPRAPRDQRTEWAYIFGAICPAKGKGAGLVMPWCDTDAMAAHLIEISAVRRRVIVPVGIAQARSGHRWR